MAPLNPKSLLFSLLSLILFASAHAISAASPTPATAWSPGHISAHIDPAIDKICKSTEYPNLCITSIAPYLNGKTDVESVLRMAMKASVNSTKSAISKVKEIASAPSTSPQMARYLGDCNDLYNSALADFKKALEALGTRDIGTMNSMLSATGTYYGTCDDTIKEMLPGKPSPVFELDAMLMKMSSNCLAIASVIKE